MVSLSQIEEVAMSDLPFGLETKNTYAALSPADLQSMGKQAAAEYLCGGVPLNDAIIKLARQHPSISPHQVQRVVEFANQETFAKMFADNEKYASDKNIEFDVADPGEVLLELNNGAKPQIMTAPPSDYSSGPVKHAHADVEADLALTQLFMGVDWATPGAEKTSAVVMSREGKVLGVLDRILPGEKRAAEVADRILESGEGNSSLAKNQPPQARGETHEEEARKLSMVMGPPIDATPPPPMPEPPMEEEGGPESSEDHHEQMLEVQREIELAKKRQELQKIQQTTLDAMNPQGAPGAVPAPGPAMPPGAPPAPPGGAPVEAAPPPPPPGPPPGPPAAGPITAPPGGEMPKMGAAQPTPEQFMAYAAHIHKVTGGSGRIDPSKADKVTKEWNKKHGTSFPMPSSFNKTSSDLTKQAMAYVKEGRPHADLVLQDLTAATSLERIKEATRTPGYPMANPYGDLVRTKEKLARLLADVTHARDKNRFIQKEAEDRFKKEVVQHMWDGGNLGEVAHLMSAVSDDQMAIKTAFDVATAELVRKGLDTDQARARAIEYEMTKGASVRTPNIGHSIAQAFQDMCKLAEGDQVLTTSHQRVLSNYDEVNRVLQEVALHVNSAQ